MAYIRCDKDCVKAAGQLSEAGVAIEQPASAIVSQKISDIKYEVYNVDYERARTDLDEDFPPLKQPDLKNGWNGDYVKLDIDNDPAVQPITGESKVDASMYMVTQNHPELEQWYRKHDVDCNHISDYKKYERVDFFGCYPAPKKAGEPAVDDPACTALGRPDDASPISFSMDGEEVLLALQDDRDNIFVTQDHIFHIRLEENTLITDLVSENLRDAPEIDWISDEEGNRYIETNGMYTRIEENPV